MMALSTFLVTCANPRCGYQNPLRHPSFQNDIKRLIGVVFQCLSCNEVNRISEDHNAEEIAAQPLAEVLPFPKIKGAEEAPRPSPAMMPKRRPQAQAEQPKKRHRDHLTQRLQMPPEVKDMFRDN